MKLDVACPNGHEATVTVDIPVKSMSAGEGIEISDPKCPQCGGTLSAPPGKYEEGSDGKMVRVGDFEDS